VDLFNGPVDPGFFRNHKQGFRAWPTIGDSANESQTGTTIPAFDGALDLKPLAL